MWVHELIFEHLDNGLEQGTVKENLMIEYTQKDFDDVEKIDKIIPFEMWLTGMSFENALREGENFHVYLSDKDKDGLHCYCVKYGVKTTQIFEIRPTEGDIEP